MAGLLQPCFGGCVEVVHRSVSGGGDTVVEKGGYLLEVEGGIWRHCGELVDS